ncbi:VanZ family protein [Simiduia curdlanivorans]|uniref:VanZ family protein n=1 Tax=Simiduia curdlanivorans TaxID=1492769 RepID=A0ABV8V5W5_9GAMM|nr:VanZ family protein [Simiduia curdlanivorans]MDN3638612.1 VanZ family protein [Simiduia curdlanivorans]
MRIFFGLLTLLFFVFICWIIISADVGFQGAIFEWVKRVPYGDKLSHFTLYLVLALLLNMALQGAAFTMEFAFFPRLGSVNFMWGSGLVFVFSVIEEISQFYIPVRTPDGGDVLANLCGVYVAAILARRFGVASMFRFKGLPSGRQD